MKRFLIHLLLLALMAPSAILMVTGAAWLRFIKIIPMPRLSKNKIDAYPWFESLFNWIDDYINP